MSARTKEYLARTGIQVVPHPAYSPDLAPADFWLFTKFKSSIAGCRFATAQQVKTASEGVTDPLPTSAFAEAFDKWVARWQRCIERAGDYVEK